MPESNIVKYHVRLKFDIEGVVEKADIIGAIFGQTEGLFGPEMNLHELQKTWKVGRIEINLVSKNDQTQGEVLIPMSTDISTSALIAAAVESVDKVGPCAARFQLVAIDDVRVVKRKVIVERAKTIMKEWASRSISEGDELLKDVTESAKRARVVSFGREGLPAGPGVYTSDNIILVEGRADVINLLRSGIENVLAIEGAKIPESVIRLSKEKRITAFLDGDRAGDLILKELEQVARIERVVRAPPGKEVEDLTPVEIIEILRGETVAESPRPMEPARPTEVAKPAEPKKVYPESLGSKVKEVFPEINGTLEAVVLDEKLDQLVRLPVNELVSRLGTTQNARCVIFDGIITQRLVESSSRVGIRTLVGHRTGDVSTVGSDLSLYTFRDFGLV